MEQGDSKLTCLEEGSLASALADPNVNPSAENSGRAAGIEGLHGGAAPKRKWWRTWIILVAMIPLGIMGLIGMGVLYELTGQEEEVKPQDREMLVNISDVAGWVKGLSPIKRYEKVTRTRYLDGAIELEYEYDCPEDDSPYVDCTVGVERRRSDAIASYVPLWTSMIIGLKLGGGAQISVQERNDLMEWGDASRFGILMRGSTPVGNIFVARKDKKVFSLLLIGVYFDNEEVGEFLMPRLSRLPGYRP